MKPSKPIAFGGQDYDYRNRLHQKNGTGRVIYFDFVILAYESLQHLEDASKSLMTKINLASLKIQFLKKGI